LGVFRIEEIREKVNETGLKEGGGIEIVNYSAFHIRDARSLRFEYLPLARRTVKVALPHGLVVAETTASFLIQCLVLLAGVHEG